MLPNFPFWTFLVTFPLPVHALSLSAAPAQATSAAMKEAFNCKWRVLAGGWVTQNTKPAARIKARKHVLAEIKQKSGAKGAFIGKGREFIKAKEMNVEQRTRANGAHMARATMNVFICDEGYKREANR